MSTFRSNVHNSLLFCFWKCKLTVMISLWCFWGEIHFSWLLLQLLGDHCFFSKWLVRHVWNHHWSHEAKAFWMSLSWGLYFLVPHVFVYRSQIAFSLWLHCWPQLLTNPLIFTYFFVYLRSLRCASKLFHGFQHTSKHCSNAVSGMSLLLIVLQDLFVARNA